MAFDAIVAGGGPAGVLAAVRLAAAAPGRRIVLLEREVVIGGRLRASAPAHRIHSYGLNAISDALFEFMRQTLAGTVSGAETRDLSEFVPRRQARLGVLAGNRLAQVGIADWFTAKGARTLGGLSASRAWGDVTESLGTHAASPEAGAMSSGAEAPLADADDSDAGEAPADDEAEVRDRAFSHYWKKPRKVPAAVVLEHFAAAFGIPDLWGAAPEALAQRAAFAAGQLHAGDWFEALSALLAAVKDSVDVVTANRIVDATLTDSGWEVSAEKGTYRAAALIVAQPPWQAAAWLKRSYWPPHVLQVASKTKPVSVVVLDETLTDASIDLPDVTLVPAERVQLIRNGDTALSFQATIDYELSLQAPAVVKAVKSLKRARKKLAVLYPGCVSESGHIALLPVAWAQSPAHSDRRWLERLGRKPLHSARLAFVGDAYGPGYNGDSNLVRSLVSGVEAVAAGLARQPVARSMAPVAGVAAGSEVLDSDAGAPIPVRSVGSESEPSAFG